MTENPEALIARRVARRLASSIGDPHLPTQVEQTLKADPLDRSPTRVDPISLAELIVNAAFLAWKIYTDLKQQRRDEENAGAPMSADAIAAGLREEALGDVAAEQRREIIDVVAHETVALGGDLAR